MPLTNDTNNTTHNASGTRYRDAEDFEESLDASDHDMHDVTRENTERYESCVLCEMTGSGHAIVDEVNSYILDNLGRVHISEMAEQVTTTMNDLPDKHLSKAMFYKHIRSHMRQQKVVINV